MSFELQIEEMPGYLAARLIGDWTAEALWGRFVFLFEQCKLTGHNKLLIDGSGAQMSVSRLDAFYLGETSKVFIEHELIVVGVGKPEGADLRRFAEFVLKNRGISLRVFRDLQAAEECLLSD